MENTNTPKPSGAGKTISIIGLVLAILVLVFSFIPCAGALAIYVAPIVLILSIVGLVLSRKAGTGNGLAIAAIVLSVLATGIAGWQAYKLSQAGDELKNSLEQMQKEIKEAQEKAAAEGTTESTEPAEGDTTTY